MSSMQGSGNLESDSKVSSSVEFGFALNSLWLFLSPAGAEYGTELEKSSSYSSNQVEWVRTQNIMTCVHGLEHMMYYSKQLEYLNACRGGRGSCYTHLKLVSPSCPLCAWFVCDTAPPSVWLVTLPVTRLGV